jgi:hypothetical protein
MCQEVGHTFGLGHQSESGADLDTCMDYSVTPNVNPDQHDYNELGLVYGHNDSSTTLDTSAVAVAAFAAVPGSGQVRLGRSTYVENLGHDVKRYSFVYWADRDRPHNRFEE